MRIIVATILLFITLQSHAQTRNDSLKGCVYPGKVSKEITAPEFPGGQSAWIKTLSSWVDSELVNFDVEDLQQGSIRCYFTIDTSGRLVNVGFCSSHNKTNKDIIRKIFERSPLWKPAFNKKGIKISYVVKQVINLDPATD
jgi:hypothetical protein